MSATSPASYRIGNSTVPATSGAAADISRTLCL